MVEYKWQPQTTPDQGAAADPAMAARVREEIADVAISELRLCDVLDVERGLVPGLRGGCAPARAPAGAGA